MKSNLKSIIMLIVVIAVVIALVSVFTSTMNPKETFEYSDLVDLFEKDLVVSFDVDGNLEINICI